MLSLTKKSDAQPVATPSWHPNFRNFERLPDTKVVRTAFFINTAAIALTAALLIWLGKNEYTLHNIGQQIAEAQREIDHSSKQNKEAIRLSGVFATEQKKLGELDTFLATPLTPLEFIGALGRTLPKEIAIDSVDARIADPNGASCTVRGRVAGTPDQATGTASSYVDMLKADAEFSRLFETITLVSINRDPQSSFMVFEIVFKAGKTAKKGGK